MALSPNYGFPEPDNASLVKNGAQDIRALGDSIDTFLFRPFTKNLTLNSSLNVWQRGTSFTAGADIYTADRWTAGRAASASGLTLTRQVTGDTTNLPNIQYCARVQRDSGNTGTGILKFYQSFETLNSIPYVGETVTFSFYARAGANFSATSSNLEAYLLSGTGTDGSVVPGFTGQATVCGSATNVLTTTWQRFTFTGTVAVTATQLGIRFYYAPTGTAGAADYFEVTGVQVEVGNQASPYTPAGSTYQAELAMCQRYYYRVGGNNVYERFGQGYATSTTNVTVTFNQPVTMRIAPSAVDFSTVLVADGSSVFTVTGLTIDQAARNVTSLNAAVASGLTQFRPYGCGANNSTSAFIGLSAEL